MMTKAESKLMTKLRLYKKFIRVAAATPKIKVADCNYNAKALLSLIEKAHDEDVRLLCFPELCITGYTCGDLFLQDVLLNSAWDALNWLVKESAELNVLAVVGLPFRFDSKLYNVAAVFCYGELLGLVPKSHIPNYGEYCESRYFSSGEGLYSPKVSMHPLKGDIHESNCKVPFGTNLLFSTPDLPEFMLGIEISQDILAPIPPSTHHAMAGATIIANLSASGEIVGKAAQRRTITAGQSARLICGYIYSSAGCGESTTDLVFSGHNIICENGVILDESKPFGDGWAVSEIDLHSIIHDRRRMNVFNFCNVADKYNEYIAKFDPACPNLSRFIDPSPFVPKNDDERHTRCEDILNIQAAGLASRLEHLGNGKVVLGISGGQDSTLALIVATRVTSDIIAVTMPCFGTTERTRKNAHALCKALNVPLREIDIQESVRQHLDDIDHHVTDDITFENVQARMRTMVLMDLANKHNGIVIGTGSMSELALGWATYNGDHMSMYGINSGIPKTLTRHMIKYIAETCSSETFLKAVLEDILDTPVSPELLAESSQNTEDIIGPYELHDFFLYHMIRKGRTPSSVYQLACIAFDKPHKDILQWMEVFYRRFFSQQFKRSCLPDGPKVGSANLSPRGSWKMPSDASSDIWLANITHKGE